MERCPDGMRGQCFYQKEAPKGLPPGTPIQVIKHSNRNVRYVVGGALETQLALVNLGCIPVHVWGSRAGHRRQPDWMVFDLDPSSSEFADVARAALLVKEALDELDLVSFPKTSGSRGLHVFVPLRVGPDFDEVLPFAEESASAWPRRIPGPHRGTAHRVSRPAGLSGLVSQQLRRDRGRALFRAPPSGSAPFSMPLRWSEVKPSLDSVEFQYRQLRKTAGRPRSVGQISSRAASPSRPRLKSSPRSSSEAGAEAPRYTKNVVQRSLLWTLLLTGVLCAQQSQAQKSKSTDQPKTQEQVPPEEDESLKPRVYPFNPLEATNDVKVGNFYYKQGKYKAALNRFREATKYNPSFPEAFLRLGDAEAKLGDKQAASDAYQKYLELAPDAKNAESIKKKIVAKH